MSDGVSNLQLGCILHSLLVVTSLPTDRRVGNTALVRKSIKEGADLGGLGIDHHQRAAHAVRVQQRPLRRGQRGGHGE